MRLSRSESERRAAVAERRAGPRPTWRSSASRRAWPSPHVGFRAAARAITLTRGRSVSTPESPRARLPAVRAITSGGDENASGGNTGGAGGRPRGAGTVGQTAKRSASRAARTSKRASCVSS